MRKNFFRKSVGICAAALMIISAGGNTLTAAAKHYHHHKRISRRITKRHMSRYNYKRGHQAYMLVQRRLRYDKKQLKKLKRSFRRHKHGRLRRFLNRDQHNLLNNIRRCNKYTRRLKMFAKAPKHYKKSRATVYRKRHVRKHRAITSNTRHHYRSHVAKTSFVSSATSPVPSASINNSNDVKYQSANTNTQSSATSESNSVSDNGYYNREIASINADNQAKSTTSSYSSTSSEATSNADTNSNATEGAENDDNIYSVEDSVSNAYKHTWQKIASSEANPSTLSNAAWSYINATSSEFKETNNPYTTKPNFAAALGHPYAIDQVGPTPSTQQLNDWYNEHSINDDTRNEDAYYWYTRYNDGYHTIDDKNESNGDELYNAEYLGKLIKLPDDIASFDGYQRLNNQYSTPMGGGGMSPQGAATQAAFDNNIDNNNIDGAVDNLDQMGD